MPIYNIRLVHNTSNKLLGQKPFDEATLADAFVSAAADADFITASAPGGIGTGGTQATLYWTELSSPLQTEGLDQATETTQLLIQAAFYSAINAALASFGVIAGQMDDSGITAATENNVAPIRITAQRALHANLRNNSGTEIGTTTTPLVINKANTTKTIQKVGIDIATSGDLAAIAAPGSGLTTRISKIWLQNAGGTDVTITLKDGSTTIHKVLLKANCANDYYFNGSVGEEEIVLTANTIFNINLSASFQIYGFIIYRTDA